MSRENVEVVRRFIEAFGRGDVDALLTSSPDVVYLPIVTFTEAQGRGGLDGFRRFMDEFLEAWGDDFTTQPETIREYADALIALIRFTGHAGASGIEISGDVFQVYRFRDNKIARIEDFTDRADALQAVGLAE